VTGYRLDDQGLGVNSRWGLGILIFFTSSRLALRLTQPPIQWVPGALTPGVEWPGCEADYSHFLVQGQGSVALYLHPHYILMAWCLVKHRYFTLPYRTLPPELITSLVV